MKTINYLLLILAIVAGIYFSMTSLVIVRAISDDPQSWMGGVSSDLTLFWAAAGVLAGGWLALATLLAIFGLLFAAKRRRGAFWLLKLPGLLGFILGLAVLVGLAVLMPDWTRVAAFPAGIAIPALLFFLVGSQFRRMNPA
jgi:hypothetical protein